MINARLRDFLLRDECGGTTVVFALWLPLIMALLMFAADVSYILFNRSYTAGVVESVNRMRALGLLDTEAEMIATIRTALDRTGDASGMFASSGISNGVIRTRVVVPVSAIDMFGFISTISEGGSITVLSSRMLEDMEL